MVIEFSMIVLDSEILQSLKFQLFPYRLLVEKVLHVEGAANTSTGG